MRIVREDTGAIRGLRAGKSEIGIAMRGGNSDHVRWDFPPWGPSLGNLRDFLRIILRLSNGKRRDALGYVR